MKTLFILNDAPYGTERSYNAMRLARHLKTGSEEVKVFLMGDAVACARAGQMQVPQTPISQLDPVGRQGHHFLRMT